MYWPLVFAEAFRASLDAIGLNLVGAIYGFLVLLGVGFLIGRKDGWAEAKKHIVQNVLYATGIAVLAWLPIFLWHFVRTPGIMRNGDKELISELKVRLISVDGQIESDKKQYQFEMAELKTECARQTGISQALQTQNRDQLNSLNGCLTQAIRMTTPEPLKTVAFRLNRGTVPIQPGKGKADKQAAVQVTTRTDYLLITNRTVTPTRVKVSCDGPIQSASGRVLQREGTPSLFLSTAGSAKLSDKEHRLQINQEWTPMDPLIVTVLSPAAMKCSINPE